MNILDWITDAVVTAWELIGLIFRSGIAETATLHEEDRDADNGPRGRRRGGHPPTPNGGVHQAQFA